MVLDSELERSLLDSGRSDPDDERSRESGATGSSDVKVKLSATEKLKASAIHTVLAVGTAVSIGAMVVSPGAAVIIMALVFMANAPYSFYKERQLTRLPALRQLNNYLKEDANQLELAVDALSQEVDELRPEAERAADVEGQLKQLAAEQGRNTDAFVELVKENGRIVAALQDNMRQRVVQDMLGIVLSSDRDNDGTFSENETAVLALKISMQLQEDGVEFDQQKFKKFMSKGRSMSQTIQIVRRLIPGEEEGNDDPDSEEEDDLDMFHVIGKDTAGGGRAARRPSLGLNHQPSKRRNSRHKKIKQLTSSVATTARSYHIV